MLAKRLKLGDTIGIVSPASPEAIDSIKAGINTLKNLGFNVKEGNHIYDKLGYLAGTDEDRARDLMDMFLDKDVKMVLWIRGGYGSMRLLPLIDYNLIKENPKIFMGYSDATCFINYLAKKCKLVTFHGPMVSSNLEDKDTLNSFLNSIMNGYKPYTIINPSSIKANCLIGGEVSGQLVGGNLALMAATMGTPYEIDIKNKILFIEEVGEEPYAIDRMLTQLLLSGKLQQCKGFILGQFKGCTLPHYDRSLTLEQIIENRILSLNKPTLANFMTGHDNPKLTLPIGAKVRLNCDLGQIEVLGGVVK